MLECFEIKNEVVLGLLKSIKVGKSPGPDGIYPRLLRQAREEIVGAFIKIIVIDKGRAVDVVYMDFSKAFNKGLHGRLTQNIKMHGIHGIWNMLPGVVVEADMLGASKGLLVKHVNMQEMEGYGPR
eukprot:g41533.t1